LEFAITIFFTQENDSGGYVKIDKKFHIENDLKKPEL